MESSRGEGVEMNPAVARVWQGIQPWRGCGKESNRGEGVEGSPAVARVWERIQPWRGDHYSR